MARPGLLKRISQHLNELLTEPAVETTAPPHPRRLHDETPATAASSVENHLRDLLGRESQALAGRVNFIGLSKIRDRVGPERWAKLAHRADDITRRAIERRLTPADVYTRYQELQYLIIFARLSKEQAQLKCALIAEEITKRLLGEDTDAHDIEVKTMVSSLRNELEFEEVPSVAELALKLVGGDPSAEVQVEAPPAKPHPAPVSETPPEPAPAPTWEEDDRRAAMRTAELHEVPDWEREPAAVNPLSALQVVYRPVWGVRQQAIVAYETAPALIDVNGRLVVGERHIPGLEAQTIQKMDLLILRKAITDIRKYSSVGLGVPVFIPVHFESLAGYTTRMGFIERCARGLTPTTRKFAAFLLCGLPEGVPPTRLAEITRLLKRYSAVVAMLMPPGQERVPGAADTGLACVGHVCAPTARSEDSERRKLERLVAAAEKAKIRSLAYEVPTISLASAAVAAGADYIVGDIIGPATDAPRGAYKFKLGDLYKEKSAES